MILIVLLAVISSCGDQSLENKQNSVESSSNEKSIELPTDFINFYRQFHTDSAYQMAHIVWPLKGIPDQADSTIDMDNFYFQKENWRIHRNFENPDNVFEQYFAVVDPKLIIEKIEMKTTNLAMERRFAKMSNDWSLIYYMGMNPTKRINSNQ